jgi:hypothetical protein
MPDWLSRFSDIANATLALMLIVEMTIRILGAGCVF